jgi:Domain of unknown function (DUF932)
MRMQTITGFRAERPLTNDELFAHAPSIFATEAHDSRSERFVPVPTLNVIDGLREAGFQPYAVQQSRTRDTSRADYTKHLVRFRSDRFEAPKVIGKTNLEVILTNGNDGSSSYKLDLGVFRFVCLNGMVAGDSYDSVRVKHQGSKVLDDVIEGTYRVIEDTPRITSQIEGWSQIKVDRDEAMLLANAAHQLRYPAAYLPEDDEAYRIATVSPERLLTARRYDDQDRTNLWTTFNVLQENVVRGGLRGFGARNGRMTRAVSRGVKGIDQNTNLNKALWTLAEGFAALKAAA